MSLRGRIKAGVIALASAPLVIFLGTWEGRGQNTVYADKLASGLPTVCKGITRHTSPFPVVVGDYWSPVRCAEVEQLVIRKTQLQLADCITNPDVSQNTFDALTSHGHNVGVPSTCASRAVALINAGRIVDGCRALAWAPDGKTPVWAYVTDAQGRKRFVQGLHNRRLAEMELCLR
ncbi:lysozyme [Pseudomonas granadensis]|uniref:lysozyme n=1 Tax=Pseudomonas granadensis TaxID=1421430 RepID=UPI0019D0E778|nr:lysozyme [Pseudomonas granadensis]MBN6773693.1 lysozyme [Pseudomonas granadensis]MBN6804996.1 lysozyme [Pseudomonas granadensis]MBN6832142.1 lysozyme [Pseudomonas granadensis]MBN6838767.1 lysozyme [Pseudomonas granadensis]MBN6867104.1 lysozyme [Pseudomonas granadensis]